MNEEINIFEKNLENFFNMKNSYNKNEKFKAYIYQGDENTKNINIIYDNQSYIYYILNIPKNKECIIKEKNEYEITITDSSFDLFFYKTSYNKNTINCILIIIINDIDIEITNENYLEFKEETLININQEDKIINLIKEKISDFIKNEKEKNGSNVYTSDVRTLFMGEKDNNFLLNKNLLENKNENMEIQIEKLMKIVSKVEINNLDINDNNTNLFINIYEVLSPSYKSLLAEKYLSEMPLNIYNLMEKYHNAKITRESFNKYKNNKILLSNKTNNILYNNNISKTIITNKENENINIINNNRKKQKFKKIRKKPIFKLKKINEKEKKEIIVIKKKINFKKKNHFKIKKEKKKQNKNNDDKMIIEEDKNNKNINIKKEIFKCISSPLPKNNGIFFVINNKK